MALVRSVLLGGCVALTVVAVFTCVRIEVYNAEFDDFLPRQDMEGAANPKWRAMPGAAMRMLMEWRFQEQNEAAGKPRDLTPEQKQEIEIKAAWHDRFSDFREFVSSWGLLQYPLTFATLGMGLWLATRRKSSAGHRTVAWGVTVIIATCIVVMFYRGYLTALGW